MYVQLLVGVNRKELSIHQQYHRYPNTNQLRPHLMDDWERIDDKSQYTNKEYGEA